MKENSNTYTRRRFLKAGTSLATTAFMAPRAAWSAGNTLSETAAGKEDDVFRQFRCPQWFRDVKFGLWLHWGPQSIPTKGAGHYARHMYVHPDDARESFGRDAWEYHRLTFGHQSDFGYKDICNLWKADKFDAEQTIRLFKKWGARYVATMANHHDNFDLFNSSVHKWNALRVGPHRDILGEFAEAARRHDLKWVATSHAFWANWWFAPAFGADKHGPRQGEPYDGNLTQADGLCTWWNGLDPQQLYAHKYEPFEREFGQRLVELVENYRPDMLYFDNGDIPPPALDACRRLYEDSRRRNGSIQTIVTVKKAQTGTLLDFEKGIADGIADEYWQTDTSLNEDWFLKTEGLDHALHHDARSLKELLVDIVSKRGALLLNIAVRHDGSIPDDQYAVMEAFGEWLQANGEAIYETVPWKTFGEGGLSAGGHFNERRVTSEPWDDSVHRFTASKDGHTLYIHIFGNPAGKEIAIRSLADRKLFRAKVKGATLVGSGATVGWRMTSDGLLLKMPETLSFKDCNIVKVKC